MGRGSRSRGGRAPGGRQALLTRAVPGEAVTLTASDGVGTRPGSDEADARVARRVTVPPPRVPGPKPGFRGPPTSCHPGASGPQQPTSRVNRRTDSMFTRGASVNNGQRKSRSQNNTESHFIYTEFEMGRIFKYFI